MRLGIFAKTFPGNDPMTVLGAARAAGYAAVQWNMACNGLPAMPDEIPTGTGAALMQASHATGIAIAAVSGTYNMAHPDPLVRAAGTRRLGLLIDFAADHGIGMVTLCTGSRDAQDQWRHHPDNQGAEAWRDMRADMEAAVTRAERRGVRLGIEPELANVVDTPQAARRLIDQLQSPALAIVLDPANLFEQANPAALRDIVAQSVDLLADRIVMAHAKDRDATGGFATAGTGVIDFAHFIACLRRAGFDGDMVTHGLSAAEAPGVADFLRGLTA